MYEWALTENMEKYTATTAWRALIHCLREKPVICHEVIFMDASTLSLQHGVLSHVSSSFSRRAAAGLSHPPWASVGPRAILSLDPAPSITLHKWQLLSKNSSFALIIQAALRRDMGSVNFVPVDINQALIHCQPEAIPLKTNRSLVIWL